ncbi:MAG: zf-HC2 domain-containing protein [Candidatus Poribacteria bacterium]|nr:zf-HC2 domain-containing protein [Candidatus Poribacteria bacterium]
MNCQQAEEHFSAHFEDTLDYQTLRGFEEHLATCEACQQEYARFQESVKTVQQLPQIEPSPYFMPTLLQRIAEERDEINGVKGTTTIGWKQLVDVFRRPVWAFSGILALILAVTGTYLYQDGSLFDRDSDSTVVTSESQKVQVATSPVVTRRAVGNGSQRLPGDVTRPSVRPLQQHYILKQVSYTNASTRGGL